MIFGEERSDGSLFYTIYQLSATGIVIEYFRI